MTKQMYEELANRLINDIFRLYSIKCPRCARARIVRLARYDTEYNGKPYEENIRYRERMFRGL